MTDKYVERLLDLAIAEDLGNGDHTTQACVSADKIGQAELYVKEPGIIAGLEIAKIVFKKYNENIGFHAAKKDGDHLKKGEVAFTVFGSVQGILSAERLVLNLMQRMSGIATVTNRYQERIKHTKARVLDTRKTTPGMRWFEKEAVKIGGGENHRFGLFDMILIKDNHVDAAGGIKQAIDRAHDYLTFKNLDLQIEIEVRTFEELQQALDRGGVDRIMLDNFTVDHTKEAVKLNNGSFELESSGGITLDTIQGYAEAGVDFISVGALTHSVKSLDLSLKLTEA